MSMDMEKFVGVGLWRRALSWVAASGLLAFVGCGDAVDPEFTFTDRVMSYDVAGEAGARAAEIYGGINNLPSELKVWAMTSTSQKPYIPGDVLAKRAHGWDTEVTRYWPTEPLDFWTHNDVGGTFKFNSGNPTLDNVVIPADPSKQLDFVYASAHSRSEGPVNFALKHALCQVEFRVRCDNPALYVEISEVGIGGIAMSGSFSFPANDTDRGTWTTSTNPTGASDFKLPATVKIDGKTDGKIDGKTDGKTDTAVSLTGTETSQLMTLIPQTREAWSRGGKVDGAFLSARVKVFNVLAGSYDPDNDVCVWGNVEGGRRLAVPVKVAWEANRRYVYTLVFSTSQFTSDPRDGAQMSGQAITYGVTVESFQDEYNYQDVNVSGQGGGTTPGGSDDPAQSPEGLFGLTWATANLRSFDDSNDNPGNDYSCPRFSYIPDVPLASQGLAITRATPRDVIASSDDTYDYHFQWNRNFGFRSTTDSYNVAVTTPNKALYYEVYTDSRARAWALENIATFLRISDKNDWATDNDRPSWDSDGDPCKLPEGYSIPTAEELTTLIPGGAKGQYTLPSTSFTVGGAQLTPFHVATDGSTTHVWSRHSAAGATGLDLRRINGTHTLGSLTAASLTSPLASVLLPASGHRDEVGTKGVKDTATAGYYWSATTSTNGQALGITFKFEGTTVSVDACAMPRRYGCSLRLLAQ